MLKAISPGWFVAQYKANSFFIAKKNLEKQGLKTFLPLIQITGRNKTRFTSQFTPLFPGYIFIFFNGSFHRWEAINNTIGLSRLITSNKIPQKLPDDFINNLKKRCSIEGHLILGKSLKTGDKAEIMKGPFTSMVGSIENIDPRDRVTILFDILGRKTKTILSNNDIKAAY